MSRDTITVWAFLATAFRMALKLSLVPIVGYVLLLVMDHFVHGALATLEESLRRAGW